MPTRQIAVKPKQIVNAPTARPAAYRPSERDGKSAIETGNVTVSVSGIGTAIVTGTGIAAHALLATTNASAASVRKSANASIAHAVIPAEVGMSWIMVPIPEAPQAMIVGADVTATRKVLPVALRSATDVIVGSANAAAVPGETGTVASGLQRQPMMERKRKRPSTPVVKKGRLKKIK